MASDGLATVKGHAAKFSVSVWLLLGGLVLTVIATFLPFATESVKLFGETLASQQLPTTGAAKAVVIVLVALAVFLAFPALTGSELASSRLIGLSIVVGLLGALTVVWFLNVSSENNKGGDVVSVTPGVGLFLYGLGVVVAAVGVVRLWIDRSKTLKQAY
ncbi:MAG TPA: hypothetical protein VME67_17050 [Mycobacterium sp.]|nr:hypothetical protein [Mycobacterium sp.]HTX96412.1 hypothetical protein [Mycobacterium sp.]